MAQNSLSMTLQTFVNELERMLHEPTNRGSQRQMPKAFFLVNEDSSLQYGDMSSAGSSPFNSIGLASMCLFGSTHSKNYHGPLSKAVCIC